MLLMDPYYRTVVGFQVPDRSALSPLSLSLSLSRALFLSVSSFNKLGLACSLFIIIIISSFVPLSPFLSRALFLSSSLLVFFYSSFVCVCGVASANLHALFLPFTVTPRLPLPHVFACLHHPGPDRERVASVWAQVRAADRAWRRRPHGPTAVPDLCPVHRLCVAAVEPFPVRLRV